MSDPFMDRLLENEKVLKDLSDDKLIMLALSELMMEAAANTGCPPGTRAKFLSLSSALTDRAGIRF